MSRRDATDAILSWMHHLFEQLDAQTGLPDTESGEKIAESSPLVSSSENDSSATWSTCSLSSSLGLAATGAAGGLSLSFLKYTMPVNAIAYPPICNSVMGVPKNSTEDVTRMTSLQIPARVNAKDEEVCTTRIRDTLRKNAMSELKNRIHNPTWHGIRIECAWELGTIP